MGILSPDFGMASLAVFPSPGRMPLFLNREGSNVRLTVIVPDAASRFLITNWNACVKLPYRRSRGAGM
jgi:hypothetical protein